jgi:hypothetical protein
VIEPAVRERVALVRAWKNSQEPGFPPLASASSEQRPRSPTVVPEWARRPTPVRYGRSPWPREKVIEPAVSMGDPRAGGPVSKSIVWTSARATAGRAARRRSPIPAMALLVRDRLTVWVAWLKAVLPTLGKRLGFNSGHPI